jgi:hypothetical protein
MIATVVSARVRVRPIGSGRILPLAVYMELLYSPSEPHAIRLRDSGADELEFSRDLLEAALHPSPDTEVPTAGRVSLQLTCIGSEPVLVLRTRGIGAARQFAISPRAAATFLARTYQLVAAGEEDELIDVDAVIDRLLGRAA